MTRKYKSDFREMRSEILLFSFVFVIALLIIGKFAGVFENGGSVLYVVISLILGPVLSVVFIVTRRNITVSVSDNEVTFSRGGKVYLAFPFAQYDFTSYAVVVRSNGSPVRIRRNIRVIPLNGEKHKDCYCVNFSRDTYERCIAYIASRVRKKNFSEEDLQKARNAAAALEKEPLVFFVNKMLWVSHRKKSLIILSFVFGALAFAPLLLMLTGEVIFSIIITSIFFIIAVACEVITALKPFLKARKAPGKITLYPDKLIIDGLTFYFKDVSLIKMTPPSYTVYTALDANFLRTLRITDNNGEKVYFLGDGYDVTKKQDFGVYYEVNLDKPKIFADYEKLYESLKVLLSLQADENGESKFFTELI